MTTQLAATLLEPIRDRLRRTAERHERDGDFVRARNVHYLAAQATDIPTGFAVRFEPIAENETGKWLTAISETSRAVCDHTTFQQYLENLDINLAYRYRLDG